MLQIAAIAASGVFIAAAVSDVATRRIPNWTVVAAVGLFAVQAAATPSAGIPWGALGVAGGVLAAGFLIFTFGAMGAGDAKLLSAVALWAGPPHGLAALILVSFLGGIVALIVVTLRNVAPVRILIERTARRTVDVPDNVPYGVAIAAGGVFAAFARGGWVGGV